MSVGYRCICFVRRSAVLDEMGDTTALAERLEYFSRFVRRFSYSIDFEEYMNVSQTRLTRISCIR